MLGKYDPGTIEKKWQKAWKKDQSKPKGKQGEYYVLDMFPYPSGDGLHVGHVENFTATDIYARFKRFQGYEVLHPMGWDAFGLPAENFAIKTGIHPDQRTKESIKNFTRQIKAIGLSYDWDRELNTSSPEYYRWTQWMFLFLYKNGLAYKKKAKVNWCPSCQTVLANEQVIDGKCDRSGDTVIQKDLEQWFFKITDFIEPTKAKDGKRVAGLLSGLEKIDWPESTKAAQRHWIGRSEGAEAVFYIADTEEEVRVFTTRLDTIYGCTYVVVAPEHPIVAKLLNDKFQISSFKNKGEVEKYLAATKKKTDLERTELNKEKTGVCLGGIEAVHPFTGERLPVFAADYVLGTYGTGAVMGVPAHDERDFAFAKKYGLEIKESVVRYFQPTDKNQARAGVETVKRNAIAMLLRNEKGEYCVLDEKENTLIPGGGIENGEDKQAAALREIVEETGYTDVLIEDIAEESFVTHYYRFPKKRNALNRTWIAYAYLKGDKKVRSEVEDGKHSLRWVPAKDLGTTLTLLQQQHAAKKLEYEYIPFTEDGLVVDSGEFSGFTSEEAREKMAAWLKKEGLGKKVVNYRLRDWLISRQRYWGAPIPIIYCDACGMVPVPEKDLPVKLPTDVDFRPTGESPLVRSEAFHKVKCPKCGAKARRESDTMDTFVCSSWYYLRYADPHNTEQFASKKALEKYLPVDFYMGGAEHTVLHLLYARFFTKALRQYGHLNFDEPFLKLRHQGIILGEDGNKMSKSKGNVVNPDQIIAEFGADSLRLYEMFMGPLDDMKAWNTASIIGLRRFLEKVWRLAERVESDKRQVTSDKALDSLLHQTIKKVTEDIEDFKFNTAISSLMILVNALEKESTLQVSSFRTLLTLLAPFAPHIAEELWSQLGEKKSIFLAPWPKYDAKKIVAETVTIAVQINGKVRSTIELAPTATEAEAKEQAMADTNVQSYLQGKAVRKFIYVSGRIVNIVVG